MPILDFNTGITTGMVGDTAEVAGKGSTNTARISPNVKEGLTIDRLNYRDEVAILRFHQERNEVWISFYMYQQEQDIHPAFDGRPIFTFYGTDTNGDRRVWGAMDGFTDTGGRFARFYLITNGELPDETESGVEILNGIDLMPTDGARTRVDIHAKIDDVDGRVEVWLNQASVAVYTGDTLRNPNLSTVSEGVIGVFGNYMNGAVNYNNDNTFSAAFAADEPTVPITMLQHEIVGNGAFQEMTGDYTDINLLGDFDDSTKLETTLTNQTSTFTKTAIPLTYQSGFEILAVGLCSRSVVGIELGVNNIELLTYDGVNYGLSGNIPVDNLIQPKKHIFTTAPDGSEWTPANLDAVQIGIRSKA